MTVKKKLAAGLRLTVTPKVRVCAPALAQPQFCPPQAALPAGTPVLKVGVKYAPPFVMQGERGGWQGLAIELWETLALCLGTRHVYSEFATIEELIAAVAQGHIDVAVGAISITSARAQRVDFSQPFHQGAQIETCTAGHNREAPARGDFVENRAAKPGEIAGCKQIDRVRDIDQVMGDSAAVGERQFGAPDIKKSEDLDGIAVHDLAPEALRQTERKLGLSRAGGTGDGDQFAGGRDTGSGRGVQRRESQQRYTMWTSTVVLWLR